MCFDLLLILSAIVAMRHIDRQIARSYEYGLHCHNHCVPVTPLLPVLPSHALSHL